MAALRSPQRVTALLAAVLAALCAAGTAVAPAGPPLSLFPHVPSLAVAGVLAVGFFVAELQLLHAEFRGEAYSFTLAGVPLVLAVLVLPGREAVIARVAGSALAFLLQRPSPLKIGYNTAAYGFEVAVDAWLFHRLVAGQLGLALGIRSFAIIAAVDLVMSSLVLLVIALHQGGLTRVDAVGVLVPAMTFSLGSTSVGLVMLVLAKAGLLGGLLLVMLAVTAGSGYRGYRVLHRRHESLTLVHQFVSSTAGLPGWDELAVQMLSRARDVLRAERAQLVLVDANDRRCLAVGEDGPAERFMAEDDWLLQRVMQTGEPVLVTGHRGDRAHARWLADKGLRDCVIAPLRAGGSVERPGLAGVLVAANRQGEINRFTAEDVKLLQTLAGHLAVALQNNHLLERLRYDAQHDPLTGLANRALFNELLQDALTTGPAGVGILLLDLDRFKEVNDTMGHHVGDELLVVVGRRLTAGVPSGATVARLGGDEFAILVSERAHGSAALTDLAESVVHALDDPVLLHDATLSCQVSVGLAMGEPGVGAGDLLRHADTAMYAAKASASRIHWYTEELDRGRAERLALVADLKAALERNELEVAYQAKLDLPSRRVTGAEALARWHHPRLGWLSPEVFIALAESTGLIGELTRQVLRTALQACVEWRRSGLDLVVAVNLSACSVSDPALPGLVARELAAAGLPAGCLVLEITETSAISDPGVSIPVLQALAETGVTLSLDDFGTGYSSLAYLHRLPVREVKIDRSFVQALRDPARAAASEALVRSTIGLAATLGLRTVAEGIEDAETLEQLSRLGCDSAQGYHIGRPGTAGDLLALTSRLDARGGLVSLVAS